MKSRGAVCHSTGRAPTCGQIGEPCRLLRAPRRDRHCAAPPPLPIDRGFSGPCGGPARARRRLAARSQQSKPKRTTKGPRHPNQSRFKLGVSATGRESDACAPHAPRGCERAAAAERGGAGAWQEGRRRARAPACSGVAACVKGRGGATPREKARAPAGFDPPLARSHVFARPSTPLRGIAPRRTPPSTKRPDSGRFPGARVRRRSSCPNSTRSSRSSRRRFPRFQRCEVSVAGTEGLWVMAGASMARALLCAHTPNHVHVNGHGHGRGHGHGMQAALGICMAMGMACRLRGHKLGHGMQAAGAWALPWHADYMGICMYMACVGAACTQ
eukprot:353596-Chlamydomonas_euryale.AAC.4